MSFSKFVPPRRKKRVFCSREAPFPVPIESITQESASADTWFYYTAYLTRKHVIVRHSGDINFLFKMGFFGKGNLSRSQPEFNQRFRTTRVPHPDDSDVIIQPRVQSRRVYTQHVRWAGNNEDDISSNYTDSSDKEEENMDCQEADNQSKAKTTSPFPSEDPSTAETSRLQQTICSKSREMINTNSPKATSWEEEDGDFWTSNNDNKKPEISWDTEADSDFWGVGDKDKSCVNRKHEGTWNTGNGDSDFWNSEKLIVAKSELSGEQVTESVSKMDETSCDKNEVAKNVSSSAKTGCDSAIKTCDTNTSEGGNEVALHSGKTSSNDDGREENKTTDFTETRDNADKKYDVHDVHLEEAQMVDLDPLCQGDDLDGNVLVIDDSDSESRKRKKSRRKKWRPVLKRDPYSVVEHLQLSFEETFFLSYGLGCLVVVDEKQSQLNLSSLWQRFCSTQANFLPNYIAYHYYRSKGWVPKTGLKFGCDFIVYKEGPPFYHGSYSVVVRLVDEETLRENPKYTHRHLSWISLSGLNRITEHVAKELLLCYVIKPREITEESLLSPACIPQFKVQEILVSRWVSSQERQEKEEEEFP